MNHSITLEKAIQMTTLFRKEKENILGDEFKGKNILSISETFDAAPFVELLKNPDCKSMRVYFGMNDDLRVRAIFVGVNAANEDMLPVASDITKESDPVDPILEDGNLCPPTCPPASPLNTP